MGNTSDKTNNEKRKKSAVTWELVIFINVIIALVVLIASFNYFRKQINYRYEQAEENFYSTVDTMRQVAYGYLHTEQTFCDNWATYINEKNMDMETSIRFTQNVNTADNVTAHIVYYDTLEGYYSKGGSVNTVNYNEVAPQVTHAIEEARTCTKVNSHIHITRPYKNPADGVMSVGFCHNVHLVEKDGTEKDAVLIKVMPTEQFQGKWNFPTSYNDAHLALIDGNGEFIVHFEKLDKENFFTYLSENNNIDNSAMSNIKKSFTKNDHGNLKYNNSDGKESIYAYKRLEDNEEWMLVACIPRESLNVTPLDLTIAIIILVGLFVIMIFDGLYLITVNNHLKHSMEETKFANEAKTRFLSSMSHDIRTPMNAIIGMTNIAAKRIDDKKQVRECLNQITRASNHLLTLVNDILDISKVESGKLSMNPAVFSLADSMSNIISIAQPHIKEKNMEFEIHVHNVINEYIFADELRLNQVLINLISNAIKYTPAGGRVTLDLEEKPSNKGDNMICLVYTISDTGIGISEEFMKNMYDAFTRDTDSRINTVQGTGLGLAITKQMVDIMDGNIEVESQVGKGTTFTVTIDFPIGDEKIENMTLPPLNMLVVDDDDIFLKSAGETLKSMGVEADMVSNGADAIEMIEEHHKNDNDYECVIVDWKMPDMNGLETLRKIREKAGKDVTVIIISAYDWTEIESDAIQSGANGFITKPLFRSNVYGKLNELFNFNKSEKSVAEEKSYDIEGLNLLVAEDNDINWDIVQVMLEFNGITSTRAENGQICVDMINEAPKGTYDAILMDVQMPVMNGKEATRAIRASDKDYVKNIPIIAMTADAFAEDIIACKEAGMNAHVSKPLDMKKLVKELRHVIKNREK